MLCIDLCSHSIFSRLTKENLTLTFITLWANSADDKFITFFLFLFFLWKIGFDIQWRQETIRMKCQILFSEKKLNDQNVVC